MVALLSLFLNLLISPLKPRSRLEAENAALRHQLVVLRRKLRGRIEFMNGDRLFFILLYRLFPSVLKAMTIVRRGSIVNECQTDDVSIELLGRSPATASGAGGWAIQSRPPAQTAGGSVRGLQDGVRCRS